MGARARRVKLCYLDETGYSGSNLHDPQQPFYILGGLIVPSAAWRETTRALKSEIRLASEELPNEVLAAIQATGRVWRRWSKRFLGNPADWAALSPRERVLLRNKIEGHFGSRFEIHAVDLFQGHEDFEGISEARRLTIADKILSVVEGQPLS